MAGIAMDIIQTFFDVKYKRTPPLLPIADAVVRSRQQAAAFSKAVDAFNAAVGMGKGDLEVSNRFFDVRPLMLEPSICRSDNTNITLDLQESLRLAYLGEQSMVVRLNFRGVHRSEFASAFREFSAFGKGFALTPDTMDAYINGIQRATEVARGLTFAFNTKNPQPTNDELRDVRAQIELAARKELRKHINAIDTRVTAGAVAQPDSPAPSVLQAPKRSKSASAIAP